MTSSVPDHATGLRGWLAAAATVACWSGFVLVSRVGGQSELTAWDVMLVRYVVGTALLLPLAWRALRGLSPGRGLVLAALGGVGYCSLAYEGFRHTSAVHAGVMLPGVLPFASALVGGWLLQERGSIVRSIGLLLVAAGAVLMLMTRGGDGGLLGDLLLVLSAWVWALYVVLVKRWQVSPWTGAVHTALWTLLLLLPVWALWLPSGLAQASWQTILLQALYQGVIATVVAMLCYLTAVQRLGASVVGALMALVPVLSGLGAAAWLGERLVPLEGVAMGVTALGAFLAAGLLQRRRPSA